MKERPICGRCKENPAISIYPIEGKNIFVCGNCILELAQAKSNNSI